MRHIRTFSRYFPKYHTRAGEPTYFVEKFYNWLLLQPAMDSFDTIDKLIKCYNPAIDEKIFHDFKYSMQIGVDGIKNHTIRAGNHVNIGDTISFRVWSGKPYQSKQIIIAPDLQVVKTWQFDFIFHVGWYQQILNGIEREGVDLTAKIAKNDGLILPDFLDWFNKTPTKKSIFSGQIICWNSNIQY